MYLHRSVQERGGRMRVRESEGEREREWGRMRERVEEVG